MHVIFISACQKRAIRRSRAILDSYALRAGERCWMSPMTTEGLQEVRAALARSATRQTSVACYQNDGRRRMKLLWIVGARGRFGPEGHFPAGYRRITTPVRVSEWVRHAGLAARLAGLLHLVETARGSGSALLAVVGLGRMGSAWPWLRRARSWLGRARAGRARLLALRPGGARTVRVRLVCARRRPSMRMLFHGGELRFLQREPQS